LNTKKNIDFAFEQSKLPGLHFMVLSQSSMKKELIDFGKFGTCIQNGELVKKEVGNQHLIIYFGLDLSYLLNVQEEFSRNRIEMDILVINRLERSLVEGTQPLDHYKSVVIVNQSKSEVSYAHRLAFEVAMIVPVTYISRVPSPNWGHVTEDLPEISPEEVVRRWKDNSHAEE
jgi:hypothetical protein